MKHLWLFAFVTVSLGCSEIVPGTCYENPAGGAGGGGTMPIGAGVGATTSGGDYATEPPKEPQDATDPPPGCSSGEEPEIGMPANQYINCTARGLDAAACSEACLAAGASCVPLANHPYKKGLEPGKLTFCKNGWPSYTCTYTFANRDACYLITIIGKTLTWRCIYSGG